MITQKHENELQQRAHAPSPVKEHRWSVLLFSIPGVALPLAAGWWVHWPLVVVPFPNTDTDWTLPIFVLVMVPVAVGAFLLSFAFRTWWVAVFAGAAWIVGEFLSAILRPFVEGGWPMLQDQEGIIMVALLPILFSMAVGAAGALALLGALGKRRASRQ